MSEKNNIIGERILQLRQNANEKQEDLAKALNCNRGSIANYEKGARTPDAYTIANIAKHYSVTSDYLLGLTDVSTSNKDVQFICDYTGLTEHTVDLFHCQKLNHNNNQKEDEYARISQQVELLHHVSRILQVELSNIYNRKLLLANQLKKTAAFFTGSKPTRKELDEMIEKALSAEGGANDGNNPKEE